MTAGMHACTSVCTCVYFPTCLPGCLCVCMHAHMHVCADFHLLWVLLFESCLFCFVLYVPVRLVVKRMHRKPCTARPLNDSPFVLAVRLSRRWRVEPFELRVCAVAVQKEDNPTRLRRCFRHVTKGSQFEPLRVGEGALRQLHVVGHRGHRQSGRHSIFFNFRFALVRRSRLRLGHILRETHLVAHLGLVPCGEWSSNSIRPPPHHHYHIIGWY